MGIAGRSALVSVLWWAAIGSCVRVAAEEAKAAYVQGAVVLEATGVAPAKDDLKPVPSYGAQPSAVEGQPTPGGPGPEKPKPGDPNEKPGEKKPSPDGKAGDEAAPKQRPAKPQQPANPEELKVRPDANGKVRFSFRGQAWADVLEWLADVSRMSLDWQELPGDYLNLSTQRSYTVEEARDLINRHLLARGFTLLKQGEVLSVVNIKKLNPGLVPRVEPEDLDKHSPNEFVKVSFTLDWLIADTAVQEFESMKSPNGKLVALEATNRLEAMDSVGNLREIYALLKQEQSGSGQERLVREFKLEHVRASEVRDLLQTLLGTEAKSAGPQMPVNPEQMEQMRQQMMMQMQQQQAGQPGGKPGAPMPGAKPKPTVNLVVNQRRNSILVHAPADKMAIIDQAIKAIDVATDQTQSLASMSHRMQIYRLAALDPDPLVKTLQDIGNLEPGARLEVDRKNRSIIAYASLADHVTIRTLISKLDGSDRKFEVIPLRRLEADYVAGTVEFMMTGKKQEKEQQRRRPYWDYDPWSSRNREQQDDTNQFRVDADVEHNRLLLWVNDIELAEVEKLLIKLGEIPSKDGSSSTMRVVELPEEKGAERLLEQIRQAWPSVAPNELRMPEPDGPREGPTSEPPAKQATPRERRSTNTTLGQPRAGVIQFAQLREKSSDLPARAAPGKVPPASQPAEVREEPAPEPPAASGRAEPPGPDKAGEHPASAEQATRTAAPVSVTRGPGGRLIITSQDPKALDAMEDLIAELSPSRKDYHIFRLKYAWAYGVAQNLKDIFAEADKKDRRGWESYFFFDSDYGRDDSSDKGRARLSKRRPLRFISDSDTNSVLVQGADSSQLAKIEELIEFYDQPEPTDAQSVRKTEVIQVRYSKAKLIADAVKDVYRDLLSANDKALADNRPRMERSYLFLSGDGDGAEQKTPKFKGLLSIGVDDTSNTLIVSAPSYLFVQVRKMIEELDESAKPAADVRVVKVGQGISSERLQETLAELLGQGSAGRRSRTPPTTQPQPKPGPPHHEGPPRSNGEGR